MHAAINAYHGPPLDCPLTMRLVFIMPRPASKVWKTRPMHREPYTAKKNDWDNLGKGVSDALNKLLYTDDGLLCQVTVERWIASGAEQPHCQVTIAEVPIETEAF
jgi:Holliday junction resolvase RusA-like endonuclease